MQQGFTSDSGFEKLLTDDCVLKLISISDLTEFVRQWVSTVDNSTIHNSVQHGWNKLLCKVEEDWIGKRYGDQTTKAEGRSFLWWGDKKVRVPRTIHKEREGIERPTAEFTANFRCGSPRDTRTSTVSLHVIRVHVTHVNIEDSDISRSDHYRCSRWLAQSKEQRSG